MEEVKKIIEIVVDYLPLLLAVASAIIVFSRTGNVKKATEELKKIKGEQEEMNYRKANYRMTENQNDGQKIESVVNKWKLDDKKGVVYEDKNDQVDLQKLIESYAETALQKVLAKYLPLQDDDVVVDENIYIGEDIDYLTEAYSEVEDIRESYGFSRDMSIEDMQKELLKRVETYQKKEAKKDEKTPQNEQKSE